jgi:sodium transport system permease protein
MQNAPALVAFLQQNDVQVLPAPQDAAAAIQNGLFDVILVIPKEYGEDFTAAQPAVVQMLLDSSRQSSLVTIQKMTQLLQQYNGMIGNLRLLARGVNPSVSQALAIQQLDVATPQSRVMIFLNMMPFLLLITIFTGGMYVVIDTTAGERERSSLEPLLINPVARWEFVIGKYAAAIPFVLSSLAITLAAYTLGFNLLPMEEFIGHKLNIGLETVVTIYLICVPIVLFGTGLQMVVATFTHSFKEAQTYVSLMAFLPALPGAFLAFLPSQADLWKMFIPTFGQQLLINQILRAETVSQMNILVSALVTTVAAGILLWIAIRLYQREQVLFGTR